MLRVAFLAVDGPALRGLERNFAFLPTVGADDLVHLPGAAVVTAPCPITHFFHSFSSSILRIPGTGLPVYT